MSVAHSAQSSDARPAGPAPGAGPAGIEARDSEPGWPWLLLVALRHAALRHDVGKANAFFARKLMRGLVASDPVRHEVLSVLLVQAEASLAGDAVEGAVPARAQRFARWFDRARDRARAMGHASPVACGTLELSDLALWLVVSHHRLLHAALGAAPTLRAHLSPAPVGDLEAVLTPSGDPFRDPEFARAWDDTRALPRVGLEPRLAVAMFMYGRLALALADRRISVARLADGVSGARANSASPVRPAQDLARHLLGVMHGCEEALGDVLAPGRGFETVDFEARRRLLELSRPSTRYAWQNYAVYIARDLAEGSVARMRGHFAVLCGATGCGKTRGALKIASTLAPDGLRLTTLLGLRSLTIQTGKAYADSANLPRESIAVVIGSTEAAGAAGAFRAHLGTDNDAETVPLLDDGRTFALPEGWGTVAGDSQRNRLLGAPVLVSTIDYMMQGADWRRAGHLLAQCRLIGADVLLDEVDGYDLVDYPAIARLCWLVGLFGRRLYLSSATATPEFVRALFEAYHAGWSAHAALLGKSPQIDAILVASDGVVPQLHRIDRAADLHERYREFADAVSRRWESLPPQRLGRIDALSDVEQIGAALEVLHAEAVGRARSHGACAAGEEESFGLVRVSRVSDCVTLARALAERAPQVLERTGVLVQVVAYHANLPIAVRAWLEAWLDRVLDRRSGPPDRALMALVREAARAAGARAIAIVVVATPVEEVGRDHDFDFGVLEPSSTRSLVQCAGRINRHRRWALPAGQVNVLVMRHNLRALEGARVAFRGPGLETKARPFASHDMSQIGARLVRTLLPAACMAQTLYDPLAQWERDAVTDHLACGVSELFLDSTAAKLTTAHIDQFPFRESTPSVEVALDEDSGAWRFSPDPDLGDEREAGRGATRPSPGIDTGFVRGPALSGAHWLMLVFGGARAMVGELATRMGIEPAEAWRRYMRLTVPVSYTDRPGEVLADPLLGIRLDRPCVLDRPVGTDATAPAELLRPPVVRLRAAPKSSPVSGARLGRSGEPAPRAGARRLG